MNAPRPNSGVSSTVRKTIETVKQITPLSTTHNISVGHNGTIFNEKKSLVPVDNMFVGEIDFSASYQPDQVGYISTEKHWHGLNKTSSVGVYVARAVVPGLFDWTGISAANVAWLDDFNNRNPSVCYAPFDGQEELTLPSGSGGPQFRYWDKWEENGETIVIKLCAPGTENGFKCYRVRAQEIECE